MKKVLIGILIILLVIMAYFTIIRGITIGNIKILSVEQIKYENEKLTQEIAQTEILMNTNYPAKTSSLDENVSSLLTARDEYLDLASVSTEEEIKEATTKEEYTVEFLLTSLGRHATSQHVNLKYEISSGSTADVNNINFTVSGSYSRIITFLSDIEDDSELGFRIRNFKLVPGGESLTATFLVTNVSVKEESLKGGSSGSEQTSAQSSTQKSSSEPEDTNTAE